MNEQKKIITFESTGLGTTIDETERVPLQPGMSFIVENIQIRKSPKFGDYAVFDGATEAEEPFHGYTTSGVIVEQARRILENFATPGNAEGALETMLFCKVIERRSTTSGRMYLTLE